MLLVVNGPTISLPDSGLLPDQAPEASQEAASQTNQVNVLESFTPTDDGSAVSEMTGGGVVEELLGSAHAVITMAPTSNTAGNEIALRHPP